LRQRVAGQERPRPAVAAVDATASERTPPASTAAASATTSPVNIATTIGFPIQIQEHERELKEVGVDAKVFPSTGSEHVYEIFEDGLTASRPPRASPCVGAECSPDTNY
jgi:hypothetical protein